LEVLLGTRHARQAQYIFAAGDDALPDEVEVDFSPTGLPKTVLVELTGMAVKENAHRVERAMVNSGFQRPQSRTMINLTPA
jgi:magnesium chelatase family protein